MFIRKEIFDALREEKQSLKDKLSLNEKTLCELEAETKRLAKLITEKSNTCNLGAWCKDCVHFGEDASYLYRKGKIMEKPHELYRYYKIGEFGKVQYCKRHLHDICPEWESK